MTPEQLQQFEAAIVAAVDEHLAKGGTINRGHFGFNTDCKCPIACLLGDLPPDQHVADTLSQKMGFPCDEAWNFIFGFDDGDPSPRLSGDPLYQLGQKLRKKYLP